jgi:hypothetical protein
MKTKEQILKEMKHILLQTREIKENVIEYTEGINNAESKLIDAKLSEVETLISDSMMVLI